MKTSRPVLQEILKQFFSGRKAVVTPEGKPGFQKIMKHIGNGKFVDKYKRLFFLFAS